MGAGPAAGARALTLHKYEVWADRQAVNATRRPGMPPGGRPRRRAPQCKVLIDPWRAAPVSAPCRIPRFARGLVRRPAS